MAMATDSLKGYPSSEGRVRMATKPVPYDGGHPEKSAGAALRITSRLAHAAREAIAPTIFFFVGFNVIVLTTNLLVAQYLVAVSNFMLATLGALVVGKAVLVANKISLLRHYDRAPLIQPILYKTAFYWVVVFFARLLERFAHFLLDGNSPADFFPYLIADFSWRRLTAISLWFFILFLIYVTAWELSTLFCPGEMRRVLFQRRPYELQLKHLDGMREGC